MSFIARILFLDHPFYSFNHYRRALLQISSLRTCQITIAHRSYPGYTPKGSAQVTRSEDGKLLTSAGRDCRFVHLGGETLVNAGRKGMVVLRMLLTFFF